MEYNEMAAKRRKKLKSYAFMRRLRLFAAILFPHSVAYAAAASVIGLFDFSRHAFPFSSLSLTHGGRIFSQPGAVLNGATKHDST